MIDIKSLTSNDAIKVGTEEEYVMLCKMLDEAGYKWQSGTSYIPLNKNVSFKEHIKDRVICPINGTHGEKYGFAILNTYTLADFLPSSSSSNSFTTLFPFNL